MTLAELREKHVKLIHDAREVIDRSDKEKRELTAEEAAQADALFAEADQVEAKIETATRRERLARSEEALRNNGERLQRNRSGLLTPPSDEAPNLGLALRSWILKGIEQDNPYEPENQRVARRLQIEDNAARCGVSLNSTNLTLQVAKRSMGVGATPGSNLRTYTELYDVFERELKYYGPVMGLVTPRDTMTGANLPIPVVDDTANLASIIADSASVGQADPAIGTPIVLGAYKYSSLEIAVSLELLQDSQYPLEPEIGPLLAERFGRAWNAHITNGSGSGQPYGLCSRAASSGVLSGGTAAAPTFASPDVLYDLTDSVDIAYQRAPGVGYMMHQTTRSKLRKLKDSQGRYLWEPSLQAGTPETFNGWPVYINPDMPVSGVSAALILFGDYRQYIWRRVSGVEFYRLDQVRILNGMISFVAFARADGNLKKPNAVKKLLAPAS